MPSDLKVLTRVSWVTPNYVGIHGGREGSLELVHRSQVDGSPRVGDWVTATGEGFEMRLKAVALAEEPKVLQYAVAG